MNVDIGKLTVPGTTGQKTYSHNCADPKIVLLFWMRDDDGTNSLADHSSTCFGAFDGTDGASTNIRYDDGYSAGSAFGTQISNLYQFVQMDPGSGTFTYWGLDTNTQLNETDFKMTWSVVGGSYTGNRVFWVVVGGADVEAKVLTVNTPTSTGTEDYEGVGFQGNALQAFWQNGPMNSSSGIVQWGRGMATGAGSECAFYLVGDFGPQPDTGRGYYTDSVVRITNPSGDPVVTADFDSWLSDGVRLDYTVTPVVAKGMILIVWKLPESAFGTITQPTSTGRQTLTGLGNILPRLTFFSGSGQTATGWDTNASAMSLGAYIWRDQQFNLYGGMNEADPTEVGCHGDDNRCMMIREEGDPFSMKCEARMFHQGTEGLDIDWSTVDATQRKFHYLSLGTTAVEVTEGFKLS
jgi:hypothetical protein